MDTLCLEGCVHFDIARKKQAPPLGAGPAAGGMYGGAGGHLALRPAKGPCGENGTAPCHRRLRRIGGAGDKTAGAGRGAGVGRALAGGCPGPGGGQIDHKPPSGGAGPGRGGGRRGAAGVGQPGGTPGFPPGSTPAFPFRRAGTAPCGSPWAKGRGGIGGVSFSRRCAWTL